MKGTGQNTIFTYLQLIIFIVSLFLFQSKMFLPAFILPSLLVIICIILSKNRIFAWTIFFYHFGLLLFLYGDRLVGLLPYSASITIVISRFLLLIPILILSYVAFKFKSPLNYYSSNVKWEAIIAFPFVWKGFHKVNVRLFLLIAIIINLFAFMPFIFKNKPEISIAFLLFLLSFSAVNAVLEELLWRGLILTRMTMLAGDKTGLIFSSLAFGLSHLMLGYSIFVCLAFAVGGFFYGGVTIKSGSLIPAIIWHFFFNILMILSGIIPFY